MKWYIYLPNTRSGWQMARLRYLPLFFISYSLSTHKFKET